MYGAIGASRRIRDQRHKIKPTEPSKQKATAPAPGHKLPATSTAAGEEKTRTYHSKGELFSKLLKELPNGKNAWKNEGAGDGNKGWREKNNKLSGSQNSKEKAAAATKTDGSVFNSLLYVGFILFTLGLIMTLVGMGDRGFKSEELKLIGPTLIVCGIIFSVLRVLFCNCTSRGCKSAPQTDERALLSPSMDTIETRTDNAGGNTNPAFQNDLEPERAQLPPIKTVKQRNPSLAPTVMGGPSMPTSSRDSPHTIPHYMDDEVEEDMALGLKVDYIEDHSSTNKAPHHHHRPGSGATVSMISEESRIQMPEVNTDSKSINSEVILNPAKLRKT